MPPQSRTTQGFAGDAVEIDLIHKGIKTSLIYMIHNNDFCQTWRYT